MKPPRHTRPWGEPVPATLAGALVMSQDVRSKVEAAADDLASSNDAVKAKIADGATTLAADKALAEGEVVAAQVEECVVDLHAVTASLAAGVDEHQRTEAALKKSRAALAESRAELATSQEQERAATWRALHDPLTGLANRALFDDRMAQAISLAQRNGWMLAVMFFDLDHFKAINDRHGHATGDAVLKAVAERLLKHARDEDTVCRNGGDEFLYLLMNPKGQANVERIAGLVSEGIAVPLNIGEVRLTLALSIGIALYPEHGTSGETLVRHADAAMYEAKARSSRLEVFQPQ